MENKTLPDGWKIAKLGEYCDVFNGKTPSKDEQRETGHPILKVKDIDENGMFIGEFDSFVDDKFFEKNKSKCLRTGDTLILNAAHNSGYVGSKKCYISDFQNNIIPTGEWLIARSNSEQLDNRFKHFLLTSNLFKLEIKKLVKGIHLYPKDVKNLKIPLPSLEIQRRIVSILERAEQTKQMRREADELTNKLLQAVFLEMFGDPIINPKNWQSKKLGDICLKIMGGGTPSKSKPEYYLGKIPWVTPKDMKEFYLRDSIDHISERAVKESTTNLIPVNSLLMVVRSGILKNKLPIAINRCEVTINQDMKTFMFKADITNTSYMLYFFTIYQKYLLKKVRSVTADNLEFNEIKNVGVILPPIELQQKFASVVEKVEAMRKNQKQSKQEIENLFGALMQKAFRGELAA